MNGIKFINAALMGAAMLLAAADANAKGGVGNGGFILECNTAPKYRVYDYEEFKKYGLTPDLGPSHLTIRQKVEFVITRLARVNPSRAARFKKYSDEFFGKSDGSAKTLLSGGGDIEELKDGEDFIPVQDLGVAHTIKGCGRPIQLAQQRDPGQKPHPLQKTYLLDLELWEKIEIEGDKDTLAGIALHEIALHDSLYPNRSFSPSSTQVRFLNAFISSEKIRTVTQQEYVKTLVPPNNNTTPSILDFDYQNLELTFSYPGRIFQSYFNQETSLSLSAINSEDSFLSPWGKINCRGPIFMDYQNYRISGCGYPMGPATKTILELLSAMGFVLSQPTYWRQELSSVSFYKDSHLKMIETNGLPIKFNGVEIAEMVMSKIEFEYDTSMRISKNFSYYKSVETDGGKLKAVKICYTDATKTFAPCPKQ